MLWQQLLDSYKNTDTSIRTLIEMRRLTDDNEREAELLSVIQDLFKVRARLMSSIQYHHAKSVLQGIELDLQGVILP